MNQTQYHTPSTQSLFPSNPYKLMTIIFKQNPDRIHIKVQEWQNKEVGTYMIIKKKPKNTTKHQPQCQRSVPMCPSIKKSQFFFFFWGCYLKGTLAVVASEAGLVEDLVVSSELINQVHSLLTCLALLGSPCKCCHPNKSPTPRKISKIPHQQNQQFKTVFLVWRLFLLQTLSVSLSNSRSEIYNSDIVRETNQVASNRSFLRL